MTNAYQYLLHDPDDLAATLSDVQTVRITDNNEEIIDIIAASDEYGHWAHGYRVYWANGRQSFLNPSVENGWFNSKREAMLFVTGFMSNYTEYFTEPSRQAIQNSLNSLLQSSINFA